LTLGALDLRTSEGQFAKAVRDQLALHLGGELTAPQQLLVSAAAIKALRLELLVQRILAPDALDSQQDGKFLAWANSLRRDLESIGIARKPLPVPTLAEHLAQRATEPRRQDDVA
jgi:hypothetical protein